MPPLPKRKTASARQGERRQHLKLTAQALMVCPQCQNPKATHRVCPTCGFYNSREVVIIDTKEKKKKQGS